MTYSRATAAVAAAAICLGTAWIAVPASARAADPIVGGQSSGDTLFPHQGNAGYDVSHYDIAMAWQQADPIADSTIDATTTITAATTGAPLSAFSLDLQGLTVGSVTVNGTPATFTREDVLAVDDATLDKHKLVITPATPVNGTFTTVVTYSGVPVAHTDPDSSSEGWNATADGATFVNQPVGSMTGFPNNDTPSDKATYTVSLDIPTTITNAAGTGDAAAVSNGVLVSKTPSEDGTRTTWLWDETKPMASELSLISIGKYAMYTSDITLASGRVLKEWSFIDPTISTSRQNTTQATRAQLPQILDRLESLYGPYPGTSVGLVTDVVPRSINYALETQDRPFFPNSASVGTTVHELMHQWFGDSVSPSDWNDIWLNEGPATYAEYQYPGDDTTADDLFDSWDGTDAADDLWTVAPAAMTSGDQLFGGQVYDRGSMALAALRTAIGDDDFTSVMQQWQSRYGGTSRRTSDFIALAEEISGRDLTDFFQDWLYDTDKPAWPAAYDLALATSATGTSAEPGQALTYTVTATNTGKVTMDGIVVEVDLAGLLTAADLDEGALPEGASLEGTTLTWTVPTTEIGTTATLSLPVTVKATASGETLAVEARATSLGSTCTACTSSLTVPEQAVTPAPQPVASGTPKVGVALTATTSGWPAGTTFTYEWLDGTRVISGAHARTFTPAAALVGHRLRVRVTGSLAHHVAQTVTSALTAPVALGTQRLQPQPRILGSLKVGGKARVNVGVHDRGARTTITWFANGKALAKHGVTLRIGSKLRHKRLTVRVVSVLPGYATVVKTSARTKRIR